MVTSPERVLPVRIEEELRKSYLDYAMSVIVARALPDVRDGLKPVQRRIFYAMHELGMRPTSPYKKSARLVGEVLGKYHPHGDAPVYEAQVRMAQDFTMRYVLVDGQGNFGSIDDDPPAAMRYTEARLARIAEELLVDIERDTVDFTQNFDGTLQEPLVLPARLPNLLANGASGIAVGMATSIPPHNLGELCDAICHIIENPEATVDDLLPLIQGPDFPTGGILMAGPERARIREAYATGQGRLLVRAKVDIQEIKRSGRSHLVISEVPYQVNKASLVEKIAQLARDKKIEGISDVRDESDREGLRVVVELKGSAQPEIVLNNLYKHTALQSAFAINLLALVDGQPRVLNLKDALQYFIDFRVQVVTRQAQFELQKARDRAHIVEGLRIALQNLDAVIRVIRESADVETARRSLMERFVLTELQAQAILDMQLRRLTALDRQKLEEEYRALQRSIAELEALLADPKKILKVVKEETQKLKQEFGDGRRTAIVEAEPEDLTREKLEPHLEVVVTLSHNGYIKRIPATTYRIQHRGGKGVVGMVTREDDAVRHMVVADTHDVLLFFTDRGRVYALKCFQIAADTSRATRGTPLINLVSLGGKEQVTSIIAVPALNIDVPLVLATLKGESKRMALRALINIRSTGLAAMDLEPGDQLVSVRLASEEDDVLIVTRRGMSIRFPVAQLPLRSRQAGGVRAIRLKPGTDDVVVAMDVIAPEGNLLLLSERGFGKLTRVSEFRRQRRSGSGILAFRVVDKKTGDVLEKTGPLALAVQVVAEDQELVVATAKAQVLRTNLQEISIRRRQAGGVSIMKLEGDDRVISVATKVSGGRLLLEQAEPAPLVPLPKPTHNGRKKT